MKKLLLLIAFVCCLSVKSGYTQSIEFCVEIINNGGAVNLLPKSPVRPPQVALDDYTLTLDFGGSYYFWSMINL